MSEWKKKNGRMQTPWFEEVDPLNTFPEYPRPQMVRKDWLNLNGLWDYKITDAQTNKISTYTGKILVPFPIESSLSGVMKPLLPKDRLWYRRIFRIPTEWNGNKILLHFGAVDWECTVWINGKEIGVHKGGYSPFSFDVTDSVLNNQDNEIIVRVYDPTNEGKQPHGKQSLNPKNIYYTSTSGIWQTIWLESVPNFCIKSFKITPDIDSSSVLVLCEVDEKEDKNFEIKLIVEKEQVQLATISGKPNEEICVKLENPQLWSPESPHLYNIKLYLSVNGSTVDEITSYFAMRKFSLEMGSVGVNQFFLNNYPYFLIGPLDQGFWPDGLYTPPTNAALLWDVELTKKFGYNCIRKHVKTESARWYHYCDILGIIVWQDMPSGGLNKTDVWGYILTNFLGGTIKDKRIHRKSGMSDPKDRLQFEVELKEMVDTLYNVPSIAIWGLFNEGWGQFDTKRISEWMMGYDPTRLVDGASGWYDQKASHFLSRHDYLDRFKLVIPNDNRGVVLSETGGYTYLISEHIWDPNKKYGYKTYDSKEDVHEAYQNMVENILKPNIDKGLSGVIYTQTTDVEIEYNGLVTYDRKVLKMDLDVIKLLNMSLRENIPKP